MPPPAWFFRKKGCWRARGPVEIVLCLYARDIPLRTIRESIAYVSHGNSHGFFFFFFFPPPPSKQLFRADNGPLSVRGGRSAAADAVGDECGWIDLPGSNYWNSIIIIDRNKKKKKGEKRKKKDKSYWTGILRACKIFTSFCPYIHATALRPCHSSWVLARSDLCGDARNVMVQKEYHINR